MAIESVKEYRCPGEDHSISRPVHLGRLARFYPACRECEHRFDTGSLSSKQLDQINEVHARISEDQLFHDEGACGSFNAMTPAIVRKLSVGLTLCLKQQTASRDSDVDENHSPTIVVAGDGRPETAEHVAAASDAVRWAGGHVIEIGEASSPCLASAIDHLSSQGDISLGGILVGNPDRSSCAVGVKFWADAASPFSRGSLLDAIRDTCRTEIDRPSRVYGSLRRFQADSHYLSTLSPAYHALRPLRFILDSTNGPIHGYLRELTRSVECRILACRMARDRMGEQIVEDKAHFGVRIEDDGEVFRAFDEQGRPIAAERLLDLLATASAARSIVLEEAAAEISSVHQVVRCGPLRAYMAQAMCKNEADLGGGPSGRFWHSDGRLPLPDALRTLTMLLVALSRSDRPLSTVLDDSVRLE